MNDYTPTFERESSSEFESGDYPEDFQYGGGLEHDYDEARSTPAMEKSGSKSDTGTSSQSGFNPHSWGEERHPTLILSLKLGTVSDDSKRYTEILDDWELVGCDCSVDAVTAEAPFPPDVELELQVFGTREGDTSRVPVEAVSANPLTLSIQGDCGTLDRIQATGCLVCQEGER